MEIVSAVHRALAGKVGQDRYLVWFGRGVRMEPCGTTLRIAAADTFRLDYLRRAFLADLAEAARIAGNLLNLEFIVDPAAATAAPTTPQKPSATTESASTPDPLPHPPSPTLTLSHSPTPPPSPSPPRPLPPP